MQVRHLFIFSFETFRTERQEWLHILRKTTVGFSPIVLLVLMLEIVGYRTGETWFESTVVQLQRSNHEVVYGPALSNSVVPYKLQRIKDVSPDIISIGSSRAGAFREQHFPGYSFYNAAYSAYTVDHYVKFMNLLSDGDHPKVLIAILDFFMLEKFWDEDWARLKLINQSTETVPGHLGVLFNIASHGFKSPRDMFLSTDGIRIGIGAIRGGGTGIPQMEAIKTLNQEARAQTPPGYRPGTMQVSQGRRLQR